MQSPATVFHKALPFAPLPWQQPQWQQLMQALAQDRLPHGLLMQGEAGIGKAHFAQALGHRLLCQQPVNDQACGQCKGCHLVRAGSHPDLKIVASEEQHKQIKVDQIRELVSFSAQKSQLGGYQVIILLGAQAMNLNASNALLKTLEEPGDKTLLMLETHQLSQLLPTIRSRCQLVSFSVPEQDIGLPWLKAQVSAQQSAAETLAEPTAAQASQETPAQPEQLLQLAQGAPLAALDYLQDELVAKRLELAQQWAQVALGQRDAVKTAGLWSKLPPRQLLAWLQSWLIDLLKLVACDEDQMVNQDLLPTFKPLAVSVEQRALFLMYDQLVRAQTLVQSTANPNVQLLLEQLLLKWSQICRQR